MEGMIKDLTTLIERIQLAQRLQNSVTGSESLALAEQLKLSLESLEIMLRIQRQQQMGGTVEEGDYLP